MGKSLSVLGSTGSIGVNTLKVAEALSETISVRYLAAGRQWEKLARQAKKFGAKAVAIVDENAAKPLKDALGSSIEVLSGRAGVSELASRDDVDIVLNGIVGSAGLEPTYRAAEAGRTIALSNKESLVMGGELIRNLMEKTGAKIYPVDSEHSAIWQCLVGEDIKSVKKLILTASGGPFREKPIDEFKDITVEEALAHPNWKMGKKVTIDSATLMNKGLEVIEAYWLFNIPQDRIDIVIHPQSIIHSMVEFRDGSVKAQMGPPDLRYPIQCALTYPDRVENPNLPRLNPVEIGNMTFAELDTSLYPCFNLALNVARRGGTWRAALVGADEAAVELFLAGQIRFTDIGPVIEQGLKDHRPIMEPSLRQIMEAAAETAQRVRSVVPMFEDA